MKNCYLSLLILFFSILNISFGNSYDIPKDKLLMYYDFNSGSLKDKSDNNKDLTISKNNIEKVEDRFGNKNNAYRFKGGYLESTGKHKTGSTVMFWMKKEKGKYNNLEFIYDYSKEPERYSRNKKVEKNSFYFYHREKKYSWNGYPILKLEKSDEWNFIAIKHTSKEVKIFVNGIEKVKYNHRFKLQTQYNKLTIGSSYSHSNSFYGLLDDVMVYKKELSNNEIKTMYEFLKKQPGEISYDEAANEGSYKYKIGTLVKVKNNEDGNYYNGEIVKRSNNGKLNVYNIKLEDDFLINNEYENLIKESTEKIFNIGDYVSVTGMKNIKYNGRIVFRESDNNYKVKYDNGGLEEVQRYHINLIKSISRSKAKEYQKKYEKYSKKKTILEKGDLIKTTKSFGREALGILKGEKDSRGKYPVEFFSGSSYSLERKHFILVELEELINKVPAQFNPDIRYKIGDEVVAKKKNNDYYEPGKILAKISEIGTYSIEFSKKAKEDVLAENIRYKDLSKNTNPSEEYKNKSNKKYRVMDYVKAKYIDGSFDLGNIAKINSDGSYKVKYNNIKYYDVLLEDIFVVKSVVNNEKETKNEKYIFVIGDLVKINITNNNDINSGYIENNNNNGTFNIKMLDGNIKEEVLEKDITLISSNNLQVGEEGKKDIAQGKEMTPGQSIDLMNKRGNLYAIGLGQGLFKYQNKKWSVVYFNKEDLKINYLSVEDWKKKFKTLDYIKLIAVDISDDGTIYVVDKDNFGYFLVDDMLKKDIKFEEFYGNVDKLIKISVGMNSNIYANGNNIFLKRIFNNPLKSRDDYKSYLWLKENGLSYDYLLDKTKQYFYWDIVNRNDLTDTEVGSDGTAGYIIDNGTFISIGLENSQLYIEEIPDKIGIGNVENIYCSKKNKLYKIEGLKLVEVKSPNGEKLIKSLKVNEKGEIVIQDTSNSIYLYKDNQWENINSEMNYFVSVSRYSYSDMTERKLDLNSDEYLREKENLQVVENEINGLKTQLKNMREELRSSDLRINEIEANKIKIEANEEELEANKIIIKKLYSKRDKIKKEVEPHGLGGIENISESNSDIFFGRIIRNGRATHNFPEGTTFGDLKKSYVELKSKIDNYIEQNKEKNKNTKDLFNRNLEIMNAVKNDTNNGYSELENKIKALEYVIETKEKEYFKEIEKIDSNLARLEAYRNLFGIQQKIYTDMKDRNILLEKLNTNLSISEIVKMKKDSLMKKISVYYMKKKQIENSLKYNTRNSKSKEELQNELIKISESYIKDLKEIYKLNEIEIVTFAEKNANEYNKKIDKLTNRINSNIDYYNEYAQKYDQTFINLGKVEKHKKRAGGKKKRSASSKSDDNLSSTFAELSFKSLEKMELGKYSDMNEIEKQSTNNDEKSVNKKRAGGKKKKRSAKSKTNVKSINNEKSNDLDLFNYNSIVDEIF